MLPPPISDTDVRPPLTRPPAPVLIGVLVVSVLLSVLAAPVGAAPTPPSARRTGAALVDGSSSSRERARGATTAREHAEADLAGAVRRRSELESRVSSLDAGTAANVSGLAVARRQVQDLAVAAYIDGGRSELLQAMLLPSDAAAVSWRVGLVTAGAGRVSDAVEHYEDLAAAALPTRRQLADELDRARAEEADARSAVVQSSAAERDAIVAADAADAAAAAASSAAAANRAADEVAARPGVAAPVVRRPSRSASPAKSAAASSTAGLGVTPSSGAASADEVAFLARVRACESRGDYTIVSSTGRYRGAYQFSVETWRGVGGSGDPAAAPPAEQDARALALLRLQGRRAWPVCGR